MKNDTFDSNSRRKMNILVVDDHMHTLETVSDIIEQMGHIPFTALSAEIAYDILANEDIDVVLTDLVLTGDNGLDILSYLRKYSPDIAAVLISGHGTVQTAVAALKDGALDFLVKPLDLTRLRAVINVATRFRETTLENRYLTSRLMEKDVLEKIIGRSPSIQRIKQLISQVASSKATILITGESGTGKELVAEAIHFLSPRNAKPMVSINSAALSSDLLESELFGHEKGAFTGAIKTKSGQFEIADGGTIFFDEIGDMPQAIQAKILRVLEKRNFTRVGGTKPISVDIRIITATNVNLKKAMEEGKFRADLYYRLNVVSVHIPPMREREGDTPLLISHFLAEFNKRDDRSCSIEPDALEALCSHTWPGNVRELRNSLERAFLVCVDERIRRVDLPDEIASISINGAVAPTVHKAPSYAGKSMDDIEKEAILASLDSTGWNKSKAASALGIGLKTLYRKLEKWDISDSKSPRE